MSAQESDATVLDAEFYLATRPKAILDGFRVGRTEKIGGETADTSI